MKRLKLFYQKIAAPGICNLSLIIICVLPLTFSGCSVFEDERNKYLGTFVFEVTTNHFLASRPPSSQTTTYTTTGTIDKYRRGDYLDDMAHLYSSEPKNKGNRLTIDFSQVIIPEIEENGEFVQNSGGTYSIGGRFNSENEVVFGISYGSIGSKYNITVTGTRK